MMDAVPSLPTITNEPVLTYAPASAEREALKRALARMAGETVEIPLHIGGQDVWTGRTFDVRAPHDHALRLGRAHEGDASHVDAAIAAALGAHPTWSRMPWAERAAVFLRAADLAATARRADLCAATMLGQSKTAHQAEIDAACELVDFLRWNVEFARRLYSEQPVSSAGVWNRSDVRPLKGFVLAVTPFNFTAIAANLPTAPAMLGNTVVWKPAKTAVLSAYWIMQILLEAGLL